MFEKIKKLFQRTNTRPDVPQPADAEQRRSYTFRGGELVQTDEVFEAWTSQDFDKMMRALDKKTNLVERHFLLMGLVDQTYRTRKEDENARQLCLEIAEKHIQEFPQIKPALMSSMGGELPNVTTFQQYATLLVENGNFVRAIEVCETALSYGLHDKTKSGFEGRIARIRKKAERGNA